MMGQPYFPPYSREQFILELESKIDESLSAPDAAQVVKLTVPGF